MAICVAFRCGSTTSIWVRCMPWEYAASHSSSHATPLGPRSLPLAGNSGAEDRSLLIRFCLIYGGVSLLLAPMLGAWATRLFGYSWPLSLVAVPLLFRGLGEAYGEALTVKKAAAAMVFLGLHLITCVLGFQGVTYTVAGVAVVLYFLGFAVLRWWFGPPVRRDGKRLQRNPQQAVSRA